MSDNPTPFSEQQTLTVQQAIDLAVQHHNAGELSEAENIYRQILEADPDQPQALHLLGVIAHQRGEHERAVDLIEKSLTLKPDYSEAHNNFGIVLQALGRLDDAVASYNEALNLNPDYPEAYNNLGVTLKDLGRLDEAVTSFQKAIEIRHDYPEAHYTLGMVFKELGQLENAAVMYEKALAFKPDYAEACNNLGNIQQAFGSLEEAASNYKKAIAINPDYPDAHNNLGNILRVLGRPEEAIKSFQRALSLMPNFAEAHNNLGIIFQEQGKGDQAIECYQKAAALKPDYAGAIANLGYVFMEIGELDKAIESYNKALEIDPKYAEVHCGLALSLVALGHRTQALKHFRKSLDLVRGTEPSKWTQDRSFRFISKTKIRHDIEQFEYIASHDSENKRFLEIANLYKAVEKEISWPDDDTITIPLSDTHRKRLGSTYNRPIHLIEAPEIAGSSLNESLDVEKITANYFSHAEGLTYFDDFLSPASLAGLRRFLLGSTIWFDFHYRGGYLGAFLREGLACPLLLQIADDLRQTFPAIFKNHQLTQLWAYKYDSSLKGIEVHADGAAINVNFWITPDSANSNSSSGGLIVHDTQAPLDWNFKSYNDDSVLIRKFLEDHGSGNTVVPYRENRIVMFNSNLFHETDVVEFKQGYENRRINITLLFGYRYI